jgi:ketosteroid isomerase-like protein
MSDDRDEISNLIARYAELLNLGQIEEVGELFRHGKITSNTQAEAYEGKEAIVEMYRSSVVFPEKLPDTLLVTTNLQIEVDGNLASSKAYWMAMHQVPTGIAAVVAGRYHDQFRRIDGTWCFHHRHMIVDMSGDLSSHLTAPLDEL